MSNTNPPPNKLRPPADPQTPATNPATADSDPRAPRVGDRVLYHPDPKLNDEATGEVEARVMAVHDQDAVTLEYLYPSAAAPVLRISRERVQRATTGAADRGQLAGTWRPSDGRATAPDEFTADAPTLDGVG
jgi:hypothetical protein